MILETSRLQLRPLRVNDLEAHQDIINSDPSAIRTGVTRTSEEDRDNLVAKMRLSDTYGLCLYAVLERQTNRFLGYAGLELLQETGEVQFSYTLSQLACEEQLTDELGRMLLGYGLHGLRLERIVAIVSPHHLASQRTLSTLGFFHEHSGIFCNADAQYWSLMRSSSMRQIVSRTPKHDSCKGTLIPCAIAVQGLP